MCPAEGLSCGGLGFCFSLARLTRRAPLLGCRLPLSLRRLWLGLCLWLRSRFGLALTGRGVLSGPLTVSDHVTVRAAAETSGLSFQRLSLGGGDLSVGEL